MSSNAPAPAVQFDSYLIDEDRIHNVPYASVFADLKHTFGILDLHTGVRIAQGRSAQALSDLEVKYLMCLIGSGSIGIHELALLDLVYDENYYGYETMISKLKKGLRRLVKKFELEISWKNGVIHVVKCPFAVVFPADCKFPASGETSRSHDASLAERPLC